MDPELLIRKIDSGLREYLRSINEDDFHEYRPGVYYPHMVGYCPLKFYYVYKNGGVYDLSDRSVNYVVAGQLVHNLIQVYLSSLGYEVEKEFELHIDDFTVKGRADAVYMGLPRHIIEIKTTGMDYSKPIPVPEPYLYQVHLYMRAFEADYTLFIFVRRSDYRRFYRVVHFNSDIYERAVNWLRNFHEAVTKDAPPKPSPYHDFECGSCPFRDKCPLFSGLERWLK